MAGESETQFVLDDFAVESAELTAGHLSKLKKLAFALNHTIFLSKSESWLIHLVGSASQSGSEEYNKALSKRRAESVQKFVERWTPGVPKTFRIVALGEATPENKKILENARDRAVGVIAQLTGRIPPKPKPIDIEDLLKPRAPARKQFTLTVVSYVIQTIGIGLGNLPIDAHVGRIAMNFTIDDGATTAKYTFMGEGFGSGLSLFFIGGARSTRRGKPQKFNAHARLRADEFAGEGMLSAVADRFLFGGRPRSGNATWHDFPMGTVSKFEYPDSATLPSKEEFGGTVTKGFKPLVPEFPAPLPPGGIFKDGI